jgi:hypothetical protein
VQVLLFIAFSVVENTFSDTFEVRFHAHVDLFLPQFIILLQLYERTKHDHIDRNVCFLFVKIKFILLLLKLRCKQCIRSTIHPLGLHSYFHFPSFSQDHSISRCGALLEHLPFYCLFITAFAISAHLHFVGYMVFTD